MSICVNCGLDPKRVPSYRENVAPKKKPEPQKTSKNRLGAVFQSMRSFARSSNIIQFVVGLVVIVLSLVVLAVLYRCIAAFGMWISVLTHNPCLEWFTAFMCGCFEVVIVAGVVRGVVFSAMLIGETVVRKIAG